MSDITLGLRIGIDGGGKCILASFVVLGDLRVDFLAENFNDLNPLFCKIWMSDDNEVMFRVGLKLQNRFDIKILVQQSNDRLLPTDGVFINPSVETSGIWAVVCVGNEGTKEVDSFLIAIFDVYFDVSEVDIGVLSGGVLSGGVLSGGECDIVNGVGKSGRANKSVKFEVGYDLAVRFG